MSKLSGVIVLVLPLIFSGCHLIFPYEAAEPVGTYYQCRSSIVKCKKTSGALHIGVVVPIPSSECNRDYYEDVELDFDQDGFGKGDRVYCDASWVVEEVGLDELKGAHWIGLPSADNLIDNQRYLEFQVLEDTEALYVAYDKTAKKVPDWLDGPGTGFALKRDQQGNPYTIRITKPENGGVAELVVYKRKTAPKQNERVALPSNQYGNVSWLPGGGNDPAMYLVLVKPQQEDDCSQAEPVFTSVSSGCFDSREEAKQMAMNKCQKDLPPNVFEKLACADPDCGPPDGEAPCGDPAVVERETGLTVAPVSFPVSSEIEFNPSSFTSQANLAIAGHTYTRDVTGNLYFDYALDDFGGLKNMNLKTMLLKLDPIDTSLGTFSDIVIALLGPVDAACMDNPAPWARPCDSYQIAAKAFVASVTAKRGSDTLIYVAQNANVLDIQIDHTGRKFTIVGGPLVTQMNIDGEDKELAIDINLTGHFLNFAPTAITEESTRFVECSLTESGGRIFSANQKEVVLDASGSFEVYNDPIPASAYKWYEDYGLVTERFLGQGKKVVIGKGELGFGVHDVTLVIQDARGITDFNTFKVEVRDTQPPSLHVPADVFMLPRMAGPVKINIGQAQGGDICSNAVMITNDAPSGMMFGPGVTQVTWKADDGRGQVSTGIQNVYVFDPVFRLNPADRLRELREVVRRLSDAVAKAAASAQACAGAEPCMLDLSGLAQTINQVSAVLGREQLDEHRRELRFAVMGRLGQASVMLEEASDLLRQSETAGAERAQLRLQAAEANRRSSVMLRDSARLIERLMSQID